MHFIPPTRNATAGGEYRDYDAATALAGSVPPAAFFNSILAELVHLISFSGQVPSAGDLQQVRKAVAAMIAAGGGGAGGGTGALKAQTLLRTSGLWTPVAGATVAAAFLFGAGGGGGAVAGTFGGGGGGGAGEVRVVIFLVTGPLTVTIGAGGAGVADASGTAGGDTSLGLLATARGGLGGPAASGSVGGAALFPAGGAAGNGGSGGFVLPAMPGGHGLGGYDSYQMGGPGGGNLLGHGPTPALMPHHLTQPAATVPGTGGAGAGYHKGYHGSGFAGGAGAAGAAWIWEY